MPETKNSDCFEKIHNRARAIFESKMQDYGPSWRVLRPISLADQIFIKAYRIRSIQEKKEQLVEDSIAEEFLGILNYALVAQIQIMIPDNEEDWETLSPPKALDWYQSKVLECQQLRLKKNHDYADAWKLMTLEGITDLILSKVLRIRQIIANNEQTIISEGIKSHFMDIYNYAIFSLKKMEASNE